MIVLLEKLETDREKERKLRCLSLMSQERFEHDINRCLLYEIILTTSVIMTNIRTNDSAPVILVN